MHGLMDHATTSHEPFTEWAALAAIGALDGEERLRFDAHVAVGCRPCEQELRQFAAVAAALPAALPDVPVPPEVRDRLLARVAARRAWPARFAARPRAGLLRRVRPYAGGLVAAGLAGVLVWGIHDTRSALESQRGLLARLEAELAAQRALTSLVSHTDTDAVPLKGTGAAGRADGWVAWSPSRKSGFLVVHNLPSLPAGKQYQLWAITGQQPSPAGVFDVDAIGHAALVVRAEVDRPELFAITAEPAGGRSAPTGAIVMKGPHL
jgi:anti-sigma-K factor RskA